MTQIDASAYDRFSVVAFAPATIREEVERLRQLLPPSGRPILAAHVTVKGTFIEPRNLDQIAEEIATCCQTASPFAIETTTVQAGAWEGYGHIGLWVRGTPLLTTLHQRLVAALRDRCVTIYGGEAEGQFWPHLTLAQQFPITDLEPALTVVHEVAPCYTFGVTEVSLVGRRDSQGWEELVTFPLLSSPSER